MAKTQYVACDAPFAARYPLASGVQARDRDGLEPILAVGGYHAMAPVQGYFGAFELGQVATTFAHQVKTAA